METAPHPSHSETASTAHAGVNPSLLEPDVTGADLTLPIFDGLSTDPTDYLIDLETDSMERHPDVRNYFHMIGGRLRRVGLGHHLRPDLDPPADPDSEERLAYDERLVKAGREELRRSRMNGEG
jgi:hypothetical protein